jgi:hypothetical protein
MIARVVLAVLLLAAAEAFNRAASIEETLAAAQERLATLRAGAVPTGYDEVERSLAFASRIPVVGEPMLADVRTQRAMASYWTGDYATLTGIQPGTAPDQTDDPDVLFLAANSAYRRLVQSKPDRAALVRGLDDVLRRYGDVLKLAPGHVDAAFNFEFTARVRDAVSRGRQTQALAEGNPSMHGEEGEPPQGTKPPEFNVIVPMRPDERQDQFDAGVGGAPTRKG